MHNRIAIFGGIYNNWLALERAINDARKRGADKIYCLGDLGAFGPYPNRIFPLIDKNNISVVQGNYDDSIGNDIGDCQCGYTDPRDNYFAQISYDYSYQDTSPKNKKWLKTLPKEIRLELGNWHILLCHGSPRKTNEFLWESTTSTHFLEKLTRDYRTDIICTTHTGIHWKRNLPNNKYFINVGVLGRPENNGQPYVGYTMLEITDHNVPSIKYIPIEYDHKQLAKKMQDENIPVEFRETILTGWWTTCLEILPVKERKRGRY